VVDRRRSPINLDKQNKQNKQKKSRIIDLMRDFLLMIFIDEFYLKVLFAFGCIVLRTSIDK